MSTSGHMSNYVSKTKKKKKPFMFGPVNPTKKDKGKEICQPSIIITLMWFGYTMSLTLKMISPPSGGIRMSHVQIQQASLDSFVYPDKCCLSSPNQAQPSWINVAYFSFPMGTKIIKRAAILGLIGVLLFSSVWSQHPRSPAHQTAGTERHGLSFITVKFKELVGR